MRVHGDCNTYRHGCRCDECRAAFAAYQKAQRLRQKTGYPDRVVSAEIARDYLCELSASGIGYRAVADVIGAAPHYVREIRAGVRKRIRESTERRLLAVDEGARADNSAVDGREATRLIDQLISQGFTMRDLAERLGYADGYIQFYKKPKISARNASRTERMYRLIMRDVSPTPSKQDLSEMRLDRMMLLASRRCA